MGKVLESISELEWDGASARGTDYEEWRSLKQEGVLVAHHAQWLTEKLTELFS